MCPPVKKCLPNPLKCIVRARHAVPLQFGFGHISLLMSYNNNSVRTHCMCPYIVYLIVFINYTVTGANRDVISITIHFAPPS